MAHQSRPEPMNASPHHPKVKVSMTFSDPYFLAGTAITGKMEVEARADKGLGLGVIMVELFAIEELTSRDHSATSTFIHTRRVFQGQGLPPSNAVLPEPLPGYPILPANYYQAQRGSAKFLFKLPLPSSSPSTINFGAGLAKVRYEVRATVGVSWKGENRLVTDTREVDVLESYELDFDRIEPEGVIVGEHGKIWVQAKVAGGLVVAGESACVELQVKNHSNKKTTGLSVTLERQLHLCGLPPGQKPPLQISDTLTTVKFRGPEYIAYPGVEGVAQLVFDVPRSARTVKGGDREGDDAAVRPKPPVFEVRCFVKLTMSLPIGSKDIQLDLPVTIYHPAALPPPEPEPPLSQPFGSPVYVPSVHPFAQPPALGQAHSPIPFDRAQSPYAYPLTPPPLQPYYDPAHQQWYGPAPAQSPYPYFSSPAPVFSPPLPGAYMHPHAQAYYYPQAPQPLVAPARPASVEPVPSSPLHTLPSGLPPSGAQHPLLPLVSSGSASHATDIVMTAVGPEEAQEGKGERASRVSHHLRMTSRHRSVSPTSHRYALPLPVPGASLSPQHSPELHSPRPLPSPTRVPVGDPFSAAALSLSLSKSERVEELERMAAAVDGDLSHDIPKQHAAGRDLEKTLPAPPVPSGKERGLGTQRPRADELFAQGDVELEDAVPAHACPKTPTLSALSLLKPPRGAVANTLFVPQQDGGESGLDALERRLLAEVGTRKLDSMSRRPDARAAVLPIAIPNAQEVDGDVNDSAISSLTLGADGGVGDAEPAGNKFEKERAKEWERVGVAGAGADFEGDVGEGVEPEQEQENDRISDERTQKQGRSHSGESDRGTRKEVGKGARSTASSGKGKQGKEKRKKRKDKDERDEEAAKLRSAAKGRVAEWLGRLAAPDAAPDTDEDGGMAGKETEAAFFGSTGAMSPFETSPMLSPLDGSPRETGKSSLALSPRASKTVVDGLPAVPPLPAFLSKRSLSREALDAKVELSTSPNAGKAEPVEPVSVGKPEPEPIADTKDSDASAKPNPRSSGFVPISTLRDNPQPRNSRFMSRRDPGLPTTSGNPTSPRARYEAALRASSSPPPLPSPGAKQPVKKADQRRWPAFPPQPADAPAKYDVRSARGGRGGKVTAVTAIWATAATGVDSAAKPIAAPRPTVPAKPVVAPKPAPDSEPHPIPGAAKKPALAATPKAPSAKPAPALKATLAAGKPRALLDLPKARPSTGSASAPQKTSPRGSPALGPAKGASVPAVVSSSLATPMLSSTASLSRPSGNGAKPPVRVPAAIPETRAPHNAIAATGRVVSPSSKAAGGEDLAFGQARLRDLIRKYQGQAA